MGILLRSGTDEEKKEVNFFAEALSGFIIVCIISLFWRNCIPFGLFETWGMGSGSTWQGIKASWPIFLWGGGLTFLGAYFTKNSRATNRDAEEIIVKGTIISVAAGVLEEISFRWWLFYAEIVCVKIVSFLTCGLVEWLMVKAFIPVADWLTIGCMHNYLCNPAWGWAVGAAILGSNGRFRSGHAYLGPFGWANSWFIGMFFFHIMFTYGLLAAILVHFIYDQIIFTIRYVDAAHERSLGWA